MSQEYNKSQLTKFIAKYNGQRVTDPWGLYKNQCVSLCKRWLQFNGWPMRRGNAIDWQRNGYNGYAFYVYHTGMIPLVGDMPVLRIGRFGHIGIVESGDKNTMVLFQQNDPIGSPAHTKTYNYSQCVGFLRKL